MFPFIGFIKHIFKNSKIKKKLTQFNAVIQLVDQIQSKKTLNIEKKDGCETICTG